MGENGPKQLDIPFFAIFGHFSPSLLAYGQPLYSISAIIDENGITATGCCCIDICKEKATQGYEHPIFPTFA